MKSRYVALFLGWLVPGLGHYYAGKKGKGALFFFVITAAAVVGLALGEFHNVYFGLKHYQFYAEVGNGLFTVGVSAIAHKLMVTPVEYSASAASLAQVIPIGDLYLMLAGLLNYIIAANAFDVLSPGAKDAT